MILRTYKIHDSLIIIMFVFLHLDLSINKFIIIFYILYLLSNFIVGTLIIDLTVHISCIEHGRIIWIPPYQFLRYLIRLLL